jgi:hypothetical protein
MKKLFYLILCFFIAFEIQALSSYEATYDLSGTSDLGKLKIGDARYKLVTDNNDEFIFSSEAFTDSIWKTLYDYSRYERSIGLKIDNYINSHYYDLVEIEKGELAKNNKIRIYPQKNYAIFNNEQRWETISKSILDELSIYLALSEDVQKNPDQDVFTYQVIDEKGINQVNFKFENYETITINNIEIESMKMTSPELELSLNLSKAFNFLPVIINRVNKKNHYQLTLSQFKELP